MGGINFGLWIVQYFCYGTVGVTVAFDTTVQDIFVTSSLKVKEILHKKVQVSWTYCTPSIHNALLKFYAAEVND